MTATDPHRERGASGPAAIGGPGRPPGLWRLLRLLAALLAACLVLGDVATSSAARPGRPARPGRAAPHGAAGAGGVLTARQESTLMTIAAQTWSFFTEDLDPATHLPMNNVPATGPAAEGRFTSPTEIGFYLMALAAAADLDVVSAADATAAAGQELQALQRLQTYRGFPLRWYSTATGEPLGGPHGGALRGGGFVSTVDDAWYAAGLIVARREFPALAAGYGTLLGAMDFSLLYDGVKNQLYSGYQVGSGPTRNTYALLFGGTRIADYMAIGSRTVPGALWWGLDRTPPPGAHQRHVPVGSDAAYRDPQTGSTYRVFEGHYTYAGIDYVPTFAGSLFQALAPSLLVPEAAWDPSGFALNNTNTVAAQIRYASRGLHLAAWGLAPATTPGRPNGYAQYGAPELAVRTGAIPHDAVTPYASFLALTVDPSAAFANIASLMRTYRVATRHGLLDAVNPATGKVAGRYMAVSQGVILAAIDDALHHGHLQQDFAADPYASAIKPYVSLEQFSLAPGGAAPAP